jgi:hypothetical protein
MVEDETGHRLTYDHAALYPIFFGRTVMFTLKLSAGTVDNNDVVRMFNDDIPGSFKRYDLLGNPILNTEIYIEFYDLPCIFRQHDFAVVIRQNQIQHPPSNPWRKMIDDEKSRLQQNF